MTTHQHFEAITNLMEQIYEKKNHDYGNSFDQSLNKHGIIAAVVRMEDKKNRIESLIKTKQMVNDESIIDTLTDLANYSIMAAAWMGRRNYKKMMEDFRNLCAEEDFKDILDGGILRAAQEFKDEFMVLDANSNEQSVFDSLLTIAQTSIAARIWLEMEGTKQ